MNLFKTQWRIQILEEGKEKLREVRLTQGRILKLDTSVAREVASQVIVWPHQNDEK